MTPEDRKKLLELLPECIETPGVTINPVQVLIWVRELLVYLDKCEDELKETWGIIHRTCCNKDRCPTEREHIARELKYIRGDS